MDEGFFKKQPSGPEIAERMKGFQSWLEVDLDAVGHNIDQVGAKTGVEIIPCVKTNAYGHGLVPVVAYMIRKGIRRVLVAKLWEALQIRDAGLNCGVVNMDPLYSENQFKTVVEKDITQTIYQKEAAERLSAASKHMGKTASIWVKVDTGLGRVGVRHTEAADLVQHISGLPGLRIDGLFSTMSESDELDRLQVECMEKLRDELRRRGIETGVMSMASSNAVFHKPYSYLDAVRPGLMLFGLYPEDEDRGQGIELRQAFRFMARIEHVKWVEAGESLTYSRRFTAPRRMRVGTLHIGYSDGYPRGLTQRGFVRVNGEVKPVLGTVSVNHVLVDLTDTDAGVSDAVEAIGREGENGAHNLCRLAGIMTYTLMVGMSPLTPRVYYMGGEPVALSEPRLTEA
jgi:alanine racemase